MTELNRDTTETQRDQVTRIVTAFNSYEELLKANRTSSDETDSIKAVDALVQVFNTKQSIRGKGRIIV